MSRAPQAGPTDDPSRGWSTAAKRVVVVVPGASFRPSVPQLFLPMLAAVRRGAVGRPVEWRSPEEVDHLSEVRRERWVHPQVAPLLRDPDPTRTLVIAKSPGTRAAATVADLRLPTIWITPLRTEPCVTAALARASAPFLLVGGTGAVWWRSDAASELTPHVLELAVRTTASSSPVRSTGP